MTIKTIIYLACMGFPALVMADNPVDANKVLHITSLAPSDWEAICTSNTLLSSNDKACFGEVGGNTSSQKMSRITGFGPACNVAFDTHHPVANSMYIKFLPRNTTLTSITYHPPASSGTSYVALYTEVAFQLQT